MWYQHGRKDLEEAEEVLAVVGGMARKLEVLRREAVGVLAALGGKTREVEAGGGEPMFAEGGGWWRLAIEAENVEQRVRGALADVKWLEDGLRRKVEVLRGAAPSSSGGAADS